MLRCTQKLFKRYSLLHVQGPNVLDARYNSYDAKRDQYVAKKECLPGTDVDGAVPCNVDGPTSCKKILPPLFSQHKQSIVVAAKALQQGFNCQRSGHKLDTMNFGRMEFLMIAIFGIWYGYFSPSQVKKHFSHVRDVVDSHSQLFTFPQYCPSAYVRYGLAVDSKQTETQLILSDSVATKANDVENSTVHTSQIDAACTALKAESDKCTGALLNQYALVYQRLRKYTTALKLFIAASEKGHIPSLYNIGVCYEKGHGVDPSLEKAAKYFKEAADSGHAQALWNVATFHYDRRGYFEVESEELGFKYMKAAADKGLARACSFVALKYAREENWDEAFNYFNKAAEKEDRTSLFNLAICLECGLGTSYDIVRAGQCYLRAAQLGDVASQLRVGEAHRYGTRGMKKDLKEALHWLQLATENGSKKASHAVVEVQDLIAMEKTEPVNIFSFLSGENYVDVRGRESIVC